MTKHPLLVFRDLLNERQRALEDDDGDEANLPIASLQCAACGTLTPSHRGGRRVTSWTCFCGVRYDTRDVLARTRYAENGGTVLCVPCFECGARHFQVIALDKATLDEIRADKTRDWLRRMAGRSHRERPTLDAGESTWSARESPVRIRCDCGCCLSFRQLPPVDPFAR